MKLVYTLVLSLSLIPTSHAQSPEMSDKELAQHGLIRNEFGVIRPQFEVFGKSLAEQALYEEGHGTREVTISSVSNPVQIVKAMVSSFFADTTGINIAGEKRFPVNRALDLVYKTATFDINGKPMSCYLLIAGGALETRVSMDTCEHDGQASDFTLEVYLPKRSPVAHAPAVVEAAAKPAGEKAIVEGAESKVAGE